MVPQGPQATAPGCLGPLKPRRTQSAGKLGMRERLTWAAVKGDRLAYDK